MNAVVAAVGTPLEQYVTGLNGVSLDRTKIAIGTDKAGFSPLNQGVQSLVAESNGTLVPNCLAWYLKKVVNADWTQGHNDTWLGDALGANSGAALTECHVYHESINKALRLAGGNGPVTLSVFNQKYKGQKNASYTEICAVINAGFTTVHQQSTNAYVILTKTVQG